MMGDFEEGWGEAVVRGIHALGRSTSESHA